MVVTYKELDISEVEFYAELYQSVFAEEPWNEEFDKEEVIKYFAVCCQNNLYGGIVAKKNDTICGIITYYLKPSAAGMTVYIDELLVSRQVRKNGIGNMLIKEFEKSIREYGVISIIVHTNINAEAYSLYKNNEYQHDGSLVSLYKNFKE